MAKKQKKKRMKKYRQKYTTGDRVDMSKGGRVSYQVGGDVPMKPKGSAGRGPNEEEERTNQLRDNFSIERTDDVGFNREDDVQNLGKNINNTPKINTEPNEDLVEPATPQMDFDTTAAQERTERIAQTAADVQAASQGQVPEAAKIQDAVQVGIDPTTGEPLKDQQRTTMDALTDEQRAKATTAPGVTPEAVTKGTVTTAAAPQKQIGIDEQGNPIMGAAVITDTFDADTVDTQAEVDFAESQVSDDAIAKAAGVDRVEPTEGANVNIQEGALASRVVGTLSPEAKAQAARNAGSDLARVTRAKKQLRNAGLQEDAIAQLGNDPEALEDKLTEFTEQERGIIAGLPEEALVSNQMDSLLKGMEEGEIPNWAKPAVASVEAMLARRGLSASSVGRDNLFNAIIQSAVPLAQSNAQAIQQSVAQQRSIEAQAAEADAQRQQQATLQNAKNVFQLNMAQFSADQQTELANSKFLQTVSLTEASADQQSIMQNAALLSQANLTEAGFNQQAQILNAKNFLAMDMANLNNKQQANMLAAQQTQQRILSNQAAENASRQFNSASENQTRQFMASLNAQINQYNASQSNAMEQFNATQANAAEARRVGIEADINKFNSQLVTQVDQFNAQQDFARNQWNAQNAAAVEASNVQWRRQANTINTAAQNQINMQNAMNAFNLSSQSLSFLWQELRDQADFDFRSYENEENRKAQIIATAIANEGKAGEKYDDYLMSLVSTLSSSFSVANNTTGGIGRGGGR
jgi:hypothetical protein